MGREEHCKQISLACAHSNSATLGLSLLTACCFPSLPCSGSKLLCRELSDAGPGLHALARSKPLRFRFSSTPQRHRLGRGCVLCPSQVGAAQATRCLASAIFQAGWCILSPPSPSLSVSWVHSGSTVSDVLCVSSEELISGCDPPDGYQPSIDIRMFY